MGGGRWNVGTYDANASYRAATNAPTFGHHAAVSSGRASTVHELLDAHTVAGPTSPFAGQVMREVVISDEHPNPTPIGIVLDVTGSNIHAATTTHQALPQLFSLLQRKGYVDDPQINVSATGDAYSDRFPVQFGQFESDNRIDAQVEAMILEGNGGGQMSETYELMAYLFARHTYLEPLEKQGRKGYLFFIGDELPYDKVKRSHLEKYAGISVEAGASTKEIFAELQEKYNVFFLFQEQGAYRESEILPAWRELLGERALTLEDPAAVCDVIAGIVGVLEKKVTPDQVDIDLTEIGAAESSRQAVGKALAVVGSGASVATRPANVPGQIAKTAGSLPDLGRSIGTSRI
jgi:hypothetical protein